VIGRAGDASTGRTFGVAAKGVADLFSSDIPDEIDPLVRAPRVRWPAVGK
jgi:hypothetical protein